MSTESTKKAVVYGKTACPNCEKAKSLLKINNYEIEYLQLDDNEVRTAFYEKMEKEVGRPVMSVPQIFINDKYVGGFNDIEKYINDNKQTENMEFNKEF